MEHFRWGGSVMRVFASSFGLKRLLSFAALAAVSLALLVLSGCGHHCGCNKCNSCNSCKTCGGVTDASSGAYGNVGYAPQTLNDSSAYQNTTVSGTSTTFERVGETKELPTFAAPPSNIPPAVGARPINNP